MKDGTRKITTMGQELQKRADRCLHLLRKGEVTCRDSEGTTENNSSDKNINQSRNPIQIREDSFDICADY